MSHHYVQYESLNRYVFSRLLNPVTVLDDRMSTGRLFRAFGRATAKAQLPNLTRVLGTRRLPRATERSDRRVDMVVTGMHHPTSLTCHVSDVGWCETVCGLAHQQTQHNLNVIRSVMRSQCRLSRSRGVTWSPRLPSYMTRAAQFKTSCSLSHCCWLQAASRLLQTDRKSYVIYRMAIFFDDLERPLTQILRSRHYLTLIVSKTVRNADIFTMQYTRAT